MGIEAGTPLPGFQISDEALPAGGDGQVAAKTQVDALPAAPLATVHIDPCPAVAHSLQPTVHRRNSIITVERMCLR